MNNKKVIIVVALWLIAGASLLYGILTPSKLRRDLARTSSETTPQRETAKVAPAKPLVRKYAHKSNFPSWGRSPFVLVVGTESGVGQFTLSGIIENRERSPTAVINNELFQEGDVLEGYTIKAIGEESVIIEKEGREFILKLED